VLDDGDRCRAEWSLTPPLTASVAGFGRIARVGTADQPTKLIRCALTKSGSP